MPAPDGKEPGPGQQPGRERAGGAHARDGMASVRAAPGHAPARVLSAAGNQAVQRAVSEEAEADQVARDALLRMAPTGAAAPPEVPGGVRVHTGGRQARLAQALGARAFTYGTEVAFAPGEYAPGTATGQALLAHELAHVAQQQASGRRAVRRSPQADVLRATITPQWAQRLTEDELTTALTLLRGHLEEVGEAAGDHAALSQNLAIIEQEVLTRHPPHTPGHGAGLAGPAAAAAEPGSESPAPLAERVAAFKRQVLAVASQRMLANRENLGLWKQMVEESFDEQEMRHLAFAQSGAMRAYEELQHERNPAVRELRANQAYGRYQACSGCHMEVQARSLEHDRPRYGPQWQSPHERRTGAAPAGGGAQPLVDWELDWQPPPGSLLARRPTHDVDMAALAEWLRAPEDTPPPATTPAAPATAPGPAEAAAPLRPPAPAHAPGYQPPHGTVEAQLHAMFPDPEQTRASVQRLQPVLRQLGPAGYQVLPGGMFQRLEREDPAALRGEILDLMTRRQDDYVQLVRHIEAGDLDYGHFLPILQDLLPTADAEVQAAVREEMQDQAFWRKVELVVVGVASIAALLLIIFPPTTALGVAGLATLEIGLGAYGMYRGSQSVQTGRMYGLATGAHDVLTPEQQAASDAMVFGGFLEVVTGGLSWLGGWSRLGALSHAPAPPGTALAHTRTAPAVAGAAPALPGGAARTIQRGPYLLTVQPDGSAVVTVIGRPDLTMIVREGHATLYQTLGGGGGTRVVGSGPVPARSPLALPGGEAATPQLTGAASPALLQAAPATSRTLREVRNLRGQERWQEAEVWAQEMYGATGQQHFPVPARGGAEPITGTGGRHVDVPVSLPGGRTFAGEVKMYGSWRTVEGVPQQQTVPLSEPIRQQILKDAWLRDNTSGYDPRWLFLDAPPSPQLGRFLRDRNIAYVVYQ